MDTGDRVKKIGGDYSVTGTVVSAFYKASGQMRYVVEADQPRGLLHIYSAANLQPMTWFDELKVFVMLAVANLLRL